MWYTGTIYANKAEKSISFEELVEFDKQRQIEEKAELARAPAREKLSRRKKKIQIIKKIIVTSIICLY